MQTACIYKYRFWPEHVRQRINKTYTYFASGLGITSIAAYAATQATSVMRFMATRPLAVSYLCMSLLRTLSYGDYSGTFKRGLLGELLVHQLCSKFVDYTPLRCHAHWLDGKVGETRLSPS